MPVPATNLNVSEDSDMESKRIKHKLTKIFLAIKNEKEETKELAVLLKKYVEQQEKLSSKEMVKVKDQFSDLLKIAGLSIPVGL